MSLPPHPGLFTSIERRCADLNPTPVLHLPDAMDAASAMDAAGALDAAGAAGAPLSLQHVRPLLYDRDLDPDVRVALWRQIAERGRLDAERSEWPTAVVWLGLPGLRSTAYKITRNFRADRDDVEAELVTCYLEGLAEVAAHRADPGGHVLRTACSRTWALWRAALPETAVDDMNGTDGTGPPADKGLWYADYDPPGLSATLRFTVPAHRVEGVRIGALARAWGLAEEATSTGYSGRGRQVAALSLRRAGRNR
ncbi:hypothetical protein ACFXAZ_32200 [Streptomyces sp. NPDC059477]|uniref:hypothetical protein n=1 Tax=Streptomyces sp. NPDC059477 TaxID=3346847 RepID=UPI00368B865E